MAVTFLTSEDGAVYEKRLKELEKRSPAADFNASEGEPGYIQNRTHWAESNPAILPEATYEATSSGDGIILPLTVLTVGETYIASYNGNEYECVAQDVSAATEYSGAVAIGDCSISGMEGLNGNGEPFVMMYVPHEGTMLANLDGAASVTFALKGDEIVHKLDNKYIDAEWMAKPREVVLAAEKTVTNFSGTPTETTGGFPDLTADMVYDGMPVAVYLDGVRYETTVVYDEAEASFQMYAIDAAGNLVFQSYFYSNKTNFFCSGANPHIASVYKIEVPKLPEKFLPESVLTDEDLTDAVNDALAQAKESGEFDGEKGEPGEKGDPGADGYTPVRGTDYWTDADKAEIKAYVDDAILGGAW